MRLKAERCWHGGDTHSFRISGLPRGERITLYVDEDEQWSRKVAGRALNLIQAIYRIPRASVRFNVV